MAPSSFTGAPPPGCGRLTRSARLKPCSFSMHHSRRVSTSMTRSASAKYRGSSANAPSTLPGPLPRSHCARDTLFGPRGVVHSSSPRSTSSRPGLVHGSSLSICRYFSSAFSVSSSARAGAAKASIAHAAASRMRRSFIGDSSLRLTSEWRRNQNVAPRLRRLRTIQALRRSGRIVCETEAQCMGSRRKQAEKRLQSGHGTSKHLAINECVCRGKHGAPRPRGEDHGQLRSAFTMIEVCNRRQAISLGIGGLAVVSGGWVLPAQAANDAQDLIAKFTGGKKPEEARVKLDLPEIAENGNTVPMTVSVESPMTDAAYCSDVLVVADGNPRGGVVTFHFSPSSGVAEANTRIRLAETQNITAIARMNDGSCYMAVKQVKVTIGGCGG